MLKNLLHFLKYNNATVIILAIVLILGGGALAAGPEAIGEKETSIQGVDNTALLAADLDNLNLDFKIENIEQDEKYYYVTYSFLDLNQADHLWQYQLSQKTQKVSKKIKEDIGVYMAKFLGKHHEAKSRELKQEKERARSQGEQKRIEVTEYSGLIGKTLDIAAAVFPGYEPVKKVELPTPENFALPVAQAGQPAVSGNGASVQSGIDNLTKIYNDYIAEHPEILNLPTGSAPTIPTTPEIQGGGPEQPEIPSTSSGQAVEPSPSETPSPTETPAVVEPTNVEVIELPDQPATPEVAPVAEVAPTPEPAVAPIAAPTE